MELTDIWEEMSPQKTKCIKPEVLVKNFASSDLKWFNEM